MMDHGRFAATPSRMALAAGFSILLLSGLLLAGCDSAPPPPAPEARPVRVVTVEQRPTGEVIALSGTVQAETQVNLAFRIDGRVIERAVNVGDRVVADQLIARLDRENEENGVRAARAAVVAAQSALVEARNNYGRQRDLLRSGFTTRVRYDEATRTLRTAESQADSMQAQLSNAELRLGYTELRADAPGIITARGVEPGEVVQAGRMVVQIARQEGRDAVFDVPAQIKDLAPAEPRIEVSLTMEPGVVAQGRVREVAPQADAVTGTFQVRVGLIDPPPTMRLGSTVTGRLWVHGGSGIEVPAAALTRGEREPAVWIVDAATQTVSLRPVEVVRFDPGRVLIGQGLTTGDIVVTAGVQALRPGQKVRLLGATP
jgi:RND family efflux transporter MFP subunit